MKKMFLISTCCFFFTSHNIEAIEAPVQYPYGFPDDYRMDSPYDTLRPDDEITEKVNRLLNANRSNFNRIFVRTSNGVVFLNGNVATDQEKANLYYAAKSVPGVVDVQNNTVVIGSTY